MSVTSTPDLIAEFKETIENVRSLQDIISCSRYSVMFPEEIMVVINSIDQIEMFSSDNEYFSYLKVSLILWMTVNMGKKNK